VLHISGMKKAGCLSTQVQGLTFDVRWFDQVSDVLFGAA
jgi:hypothetical protein